jgi:glycosyltransferase involved in cell wall biosynthesis
MYNNRRIAIVVPAHNEARNLEAMLRELPSWVDRVFLVDDASGDETYEIASQRATRDPRLSVIRHEEKRGVGGAIASGYLAAIKERMDCAVVMAGDGQMDPQDLSRLIEPVLAGEVDYCKGNRFFYPKGLAQIPTVRLFGNFALSLLTKMASGYWHITDTQTGYTAISLEALEAIDAPNIYHSYGCPNDILIKLNIAGCRVGEVPVNPRYGLGEESKMRIPSVVFPILKVLTVGWLKRIIVRSIAKEGNPYVLSLASALLCLVSSLAIFIHLCLKYFKYGYLPNTALIVFSMVTILGLQFALAALQGDYESNRGRCVHLKALKIEPGNIEDCGPDGSSK